MPSLLDRFLRVLAICAGLCAIALLVACKGEIGCLDCNVILISLDTLRADRLGAYGYDRDTSPAIDEFAAESFVFTDVVTQHPVTLESHKSLFNGLFTSPNDEAPRISEILREHGYRTAAFTGGGLLHRRFGFGRGFDEYHDSPRMRGLAGVKPLVIEWLRRHRDTRFYLFLHTYDVHCPYTPPEPYRSMFTGGYRPTFKPRRACGLPLIGKGLKPSDIEFVSASYDGGVRWVDTQLGEILAEFKRLGLDEKSIVIILSDHGDALGEHGFFGHPNFLEEVLKVPLILRVPGQDPRVIHEPAQLVDVMPTVLRLVGIEPPAGLDGIDLGPILRGGFSFHGHRPRLTVTGPDGAAFRVGDGFVLIADPRAHEDELYDLSGDRRNLASEEPQRLARLHEELAEYLRMRHAGQTIDPGPAPNLEEIEPDLRRQLRTLGYVQ